MGAGVAGYVVSTLIAFVLVMANSSHFWEVYVAALLAYIGGLVCVGVGAYLEWKLKKSA
jgi:hypothetical protein